MLKNQKGIGGLAIMGIIYCSLLSVKAVTFVGKKIVEHHNKKHLEQSLKEANLEQVYCIKDNGQIISCHK